jgi:hypothetical protein
LWRDGRSFLKREITFFLGRNEVPFFKPVPEERHPLACDDSLPPETPLSFGGFQDVEGRTFLALIPDHASRLAIGFYAVPALQEV